MGRARLLAGTSIVLFIAWLMLAGSGADLVLSQGKATPVPVTPGPSSTPDLTDAEKTLERLHAALVPARDRVDLARRLMGVAELPDPPTSPRPYEVGDREVFFASDLTEGGTRNVEAELVYVTAHVYVWFEVGTNPPMEAVRRSADNFENQIYPVARSFFGSEDTPGIDGDPRLHILHAFRLGDDVLAYYDAESELPRSIAPASNERQMFFVNLDTMGDDIGSLDYEATLAHEFQHMIHNHVDTNESIWLDEGLAELSAQVTGFQTQSTFTSAFTDAPDTQLNSWTELGNSNSHYGASFLYVMYFMNRFGEDAIRALVANPLNDMESVDETLRAIGAVDPITGQPMTADGIFQDWIVTNLINDARTGDGRFTYAPSLASITPLRIVDRIPVGDPQAVTVKQWGAKYLGLTETGRFELTFEGDSSVPIVPIPAHSGRLFWWSNRGDQIESRLTRAFDLRGLSRATLTFNLWFSTEDGYDFGYVQVSEDGGETWTALRSEASGDDSSSLYGPAYTGVLAGGKNALWQPQSVDLSPFAGQEILVRFAYVTDESINESGIAVDDIAVPELGYFTDAESDDGGWTTEGWARVQNVLPQRFSVQLVQFGVQGAPQVTRLLGPEDGPSGRWTFEIEGDVNEAVLIIAGMTEFTDQTAVAHYELIQLE
jgi:hypothetical protein